MPRFYPFAALLNPTPSVVGPGVVQLFPPVLSMQSGVGANLTNEVAEDFSGFDPFNTGIGQNHGTRPLIVQCIVRNDFGVLGVLDQYMGLGYGSPQAGYPVPNPPNEAYIHVRFNFPLNRWELVCAVAAGGITVQVMTGVPLVTLAAPSHRLMIEFVPGQRVQGYVDGILGASQTNPILIPDFNAGAPTYGASCFVSSGGGALNQIQASFCSLSVQCFGFP